MRHVVLSAFGCGAFRNPAEHVAAVYHQELQTCTFKYSGSLPHSGLQPPAQGDPLGLRSRAWAAWAVLLWSRGPRSAAVEPFQRRPRRPFAPAVCPSRQKRAASFDVVGFGIFHAGYGPDNFAPFARAFADWPK